MTQIINNEIKAKMIRYNNDNRNWVEKLKNGLINESATKAEKEAMRELISRAVGLFSWSEEDTQEAREAICQMALLMFFNKDTSAASRRLRKLAIKKADEYKSKGSKRVENATKNHK